MQYQTTAEHAAEIGTLDGIQQTTCIDRTETILYPVGCCLKFSWQCVILVLTDTVAMMISLSTDGDIRLTQVFQFEVSTLTVGQLLIFFKGNLLVQSVVVGTIVGDVQLTIATYYRKVTTAVETAGMLCTYSDEVVMIDVVQGCRRIAEYGNRVGITLTV